MGSALRIAMWSGPRNLSTALMRSFSSRDDTVVLDEPFYAHYLHYTGIAHPGREQVIAAYETDWRKVVDYITGPVPDGRAVWYQKHMAHHMLSHIDLNRLVDDDVLKHTFLIRDPAEVILSYLKVHPDMTIVETALPQQVELFSLVVRKSGRIPPVIDSKDLLLDPGRTLSSLCEKLGLEYSDKMLSWPKGPHPNDGNWAPHWYNNVYQSSCFEPYLVKEVRLPITFRTMLQQARALYDELAQHKL
jgi:hypothetical protein